MSVRCVAAILSSFGANECAGPKYKSSHGWDQEVHGGCQRVEKIGRIRGVTDAKSGNQAPPVAQADRDGYPEQSDKCPCAPGQVERRIGPNSAALSGRDAGLIHRTDAWSDARYLIAQERAGIDEQIFAVQISHHDKVKVGSHEQKEFPENTHEIRKGHGSKQAQGKRGNIEEVLALGEKR